MKRVLIMLLVSFAAAAHAHIGSPNVFFDGKAGEYSVHVVVQPPNVVPGLAEISIRVEGDGVRRVTALPVFWDAGRNGAPPADAAKPVPGETNLYSTTLWLMKPGGYSVDVSVEGAHPGGTVMVPVNAVATNTLGMSKTLAAILAVLGFLLFAVAVRVAGAVFGESLLPPGQVMTPARILRSRIAMTITAALVLLAFWGEKKWWDFKEQEYRQKTLYRPEGLLARIANQTNEILLKLELGESDDPTQPPRLIPDHGKLMHLFLIRQPGLDVFAHLHPVKRNWENFEVALPPLPEGHYLVYADITHETGFAETLTTTADLPAPSPQSLKYWHGDSNDQICGIGVIRTAPLKGSPLLPDADDSWHIDHRASRTNALNISPVSGGRSIVWEPPGDLIENRDLSLRFRLIDTNGQPEPLEPYIGMFGHAAIRRDDGAVFAHIHPSGTFSMAAQEFYEGVTNSMRMDPSNTVSEVSFPYAFPSPGAYHVWVQLKSGGNAYTGVFEAVVKAAK